LIAASAIRVVASFASPPGGEDDTFVHRRSKRNGAYLLRPTLNL
ncbi:MAG: hypothetical protein QOD02_3875, partial [Mycobacterium sp.]|nr:hypothetical protein [Mycobacterium sp.]